MHNSQVNLWSCPEHPSYVPTLILFPVLWPMESYDLTQGTGLNLAMGCSTKFIKSKYDMVDVYREACFGVKIKFIWEHPHSYSAVDIRMLLTATNSCFSSSGCLFHLSLCTVCRPEWLCIGCQCQRADTAIQLQCLHTSLFRPRASTVQSTFNSSINLLYPVLSSNCPLEIAHGPPSSSPEAVFLSLTKCFVAGFSSVQCDTLERVLLISCLAATAHYDNHCNRPCVTC